MSYLLTYTWSDFISDNAHSLTNGAWVRVPAGLPHPEMAGFHLLDLAEPNGQVDDWALSLRDGSRIHIHVHADGSMVAHRDQWDPGSGVGAALKHFFLETRVGPLVGLAAAGVAAIWAARRSA
jgi:hypothetical protein